MTNKRKDIDTQKQANAFVDLHAAARDAVSGNVVKAVELQKPWPKVRQTLHE